jgi:tetratricopeptide (TPR) repeat protein
LFRKRAWKDAAAAYRKACELAPRNGVYLTNLASALREEGELNAAVSACRKALALDPKYAWAYRNLGLALREQEKLEEAVAAFRKADQLLPRQVSIRNDLRQSEQWLRLVPKLDACLAGKDRPAGPQEGVELARVCASYRHQYRAAVDLFNQAFRGDPRLADNLRAGHRYGAAACAARAAAGQGKDAGGLDAGQRAALRKQALAWLRQDMELSAGLARKADGRRLVRARLTSWRNDPALATVRDERSLAALPEEERGPWRQLWAGVAALLEERGGKE